MSERTLAIIEAGRREENAIGDIINRYEKAGLKPVAMRLMHLSKTTAQGFYAVHKGASVLRQPLYLHVVRTLCGAGAAR